MASQHMAVVRSAELEVRTEHDGRKTLRGVFTPFGQWAHINNWEGNFRERSLPGAFKRTIAHSWDAFNRTGRHSMVINYNHGMDPQVARKQLGKITVLEERADGPYYEVLLLDTDYNRDYVVPAAEDGLLGASYTFAVPKNGEEWNHTTGDGIPERTLLDVKVMEFGPVDHPAFEAATAGVRTASEYEWWLTLDDAGRSDYAALRARAHDLDTSPVGEPVTPAEPRSADDSPRRAPVDRKRAEQAHRRLALKFPELKGNQ